MVKLKKIYLQDYCGFRDSTFDFTDIGDSPKKLNCFYGPNGSGKSSLLHAIQMLSDAHRFYGKNIEVLFRKLIYHPDYDPTYDYPSVNQKAGKMKLHGIFATDKGQREVIITKKGIEKNELPKYQMGYSYYADSDSANNTYRFQLHAEMKDKFLDLANAIYSYPCYMGSESPDLEDGNEKYYTDFIIHKEDEDTKVHFKRMSAGEKKLATILRFLCDPSYISKFDIILIDNISMHVYKNRHAKMIDKFLDVFKNKQFFITTHSAVLTGMKDEELGIEIKPYLSSDFLYNIEEYKTKLCLSK